MGCEESVDFINSIVSGQISIKMLLNVGRSVFCYVPKILSSREKGKLLVGLLDAWGVFLWFVCFPFTGIICATSLKEDFFFFFFPLKIHEGFFQHSFAS